jgi:hypothetical protein
MLLNVMRFTSLLFTALALSASMAHLLELPNKIKLSREHYAIVQQIYRGWSLLGIVVVVAIISTLFVVMLVHERKVFLLSLSALLCLIATQAIFWFFTFPVNQQTKNWTTLPSHWPDLRRQWEYSHAASACLDLAALSLLILALLVTDEQ